MSWPIDILVAVTYWVNGSRPGIVEASSTARLPFEPKGWLVDFRRELGTACRHLVATSDQALHATYTSTDRSRSDIENILSYNLGTGALRAGAAHGLVLERSFANKVGLRHGYRYELAPRDNAWTGWRTGRPLSWMRFSAPRTAFTTAKAGMWWLHARRGHIDVHEHNDTTPEAYLLSISVNPPQQWRGALAGLLKPLADGIVSAMHAHTGPIDTVVPRAGAVDPTLAPAEFEHLLRQPRPVALGHVRLVVPWGNTLQWLPADDHIVGLEIRITDGEAPGTITAQTCLAEPALGPPGASAAG